MPIIRGDDSRRLVPQAMVQVLTVLIDERERDRPTPEWVELRSIRSRLCRVFKLPDPAAPAHAPDVAQMMEDADGIPIEE